MRLKMHIDRTTMLLPTTPLRREIESLLTQVVTARSVSFRFIEKTSDVSGDTTVIDVLTDDLSGAAKCELDVHWKGNCTLGNDAVGFRVSQLLGREIVIRNYDEQPTAWVLLTPAFGIENLVVDDDLLRSQRILRYTIA